jgi:hypothetical protein
MGEAAAQNPPLPGHLYHQKKEIRQRSLIILSLPHLEVSSVDNVLPKERKIRRSDNNKCREPRRRSGKNSAGRFLLVFSSFNIIIEFKLIFNYEYLSTI